MHIISSLHGLSSSRSDVSSKIGLIRFFVLGKPHIPVDAEHAVFCFYPSDGRVELGYFWNQSIQEIPDILIGFLITFLVLLESIPVVVLLQFLQEGQCILGDVHVLGFNGSEQRKHLLPFGFERAVDFPEIQVGSFHEAPQDSLCIGIVYLRHQCFS